MELKRAAAPNGRQPAWPRRHRTTAKPGQRQRCTQPASSRRGPGVPDVRPKVGARYRAPFLQAVQSHARAVHLRARSVRGRARVVHRRARLGHYGVHLLSEWAWSSLAFPFSVQCHPKEAVDYSSGQRAANTRAVLSKEWPYDGENGLTKNMGSHGDRFWNPAGHCWRRSRTVRRLFSSVPFSRQEAHAIHAAQVRSRMGALRFSWDVYSLT